MRSDKRQVKAAGRAAALLVVLGSGACSKAKAPPAERTEPWPAERPGVVLPAAARVERFAVQPPGRVTFVVRTKQNRIDGAIGLAKGELLVDPTDLKATRGTLSFDLASTVILTPSDAGAAEVDRLASARARNWLDVGVDRPEAERDRLRWARFEISAVSEASADRAHEGKAVGEEGARTAGSGGSSVAASEEAEIREVRLTTQGTLLLHGFRVELSVPVRLRFHYQKPAAEGAKPQQIELESLAPVPVSLQVHDIKPRDASGTLIAEELPLLGREIGPEARVSVSLLLVRGH